MLEEERNNGLSKGQKGRTIRESFLSVIHIGTRNVLGIYTLLKGDNGKKKKTSKKLRHR